MRKKLAWVVFAVLWAGGISQTVSGQANTPERQEAEERYRRLSSTLEDVLNTQMLLQKKINVLTDELRALREESMKPNTSYAAKEDLRRLALQVQDIDQKREADRRLILEEIQKLAKTPVVVPPPVTPTHVKAVDRGEDRSTDKPRIEKGYYHVVEKDQNLSLILQAYRQKGIKVTRKMVEEANPSMNPNRLLEGQKIFIPDPNK
ncbi:MAG: LysM peptidoglycan-binding domain-containing protein [Verrucomicrobia bacterium]|nr:LysM peptidoglycan-binding domain-containing protein [Verrucomicrobiota bacterium]